VAMDYAELPAFMMDLKNRQATAARALEFAILWHWVGAGARLVSKAHRGRVRSGNPFGSLAGRHAGIARPFDRRRGSTFCRR
jgi:hypothetical protein